METKRIPYYLGIDLNDQFAMISYFQPNMHEPNTVSTIAGKEEYQIPLVLAKRKGLGQWYYGEDAQKLAKTSEVICVDSLLKRAMYQETIRMGDEGFLAEELLTLFLNKVIMLPQKLGNSIYCDRLVISVEHLCRENMDLLWRIATKLGFSKEQFMVIDYKESFYYFALNQKRDLFIHDVYLIDCRQSNLYYYVLSRNLKTTPQVVTIAQSNRQTLGVERDESFSRILLKAFENKIISTVYLVGDGFDGDWMKNSLSILCRGRRAFAGKNLYSKGACYAAYIRDHEQDWPYIYMGENEMKFNISLKVKNHGKTDFFHLISAGKNWFETYGECEVILGDDYEVDFWKQLPSSREAKIETVKLTDIPIRPSRTTRVRIVAKPIADDKVEIEIKDLGFGEFFRSSDKTWRYMMSI